MYEGKSVGVVVPCYNEETQIGNVLRTMPDFVDSVIVVDDASRDRTADAVQEFMNKEDPSCRVVLLRQEVNRGAGAAVACGYREALRRGLDVAAVMDGDGQMDPGDLHLLVAPVARGDADYAKGNRLFYEGAWEMIPKVRYLGNAFLSLLTKIASGYWHVADSQTGFVAISREALETISLDNLYSRFGYPNDMLVRLNVFDMRVADVHIRPVYNIGEHSKMRLWKVIPTMSWLIFKRFCWRMWHKYVIHDFHPLVLFYAVSGLLTLASTGLFARLLWKWVATGRIPPVNALMWGFCAVSTMQFCLFAMWFDMERNRDLNANPPRSRRNPREGGPAQQPAQSQGPATSASAAGVDASATGREQQ